MFPTQITFVDSDGVQSGYLNFFLLMLLCVSITIYRFYFSPKDWSNICNAFFFIRLRFFEVSFFSFGGGGGAWCDVESQFPVQGLNLGHGGKSAESQPLDHQETPSVTMYDFSLT